MNKIKNQRGVILLMTMLILSSILVVTLGAAGSVVAGLKMNRLTGYSSLAFFASEAGLERALWEARKNNLALQNENESNILGCLGSPPACPLDNNSSYVVDFTISAPNVTFKSIGVYLGAKRSVEGAYEN